MIFFFSFFLFSKFCIADYDIMVLQIASHLANHLYEGLETKTQSEALNDALEKPQKPEKRKNWRRLRALRKKRVSLVYRSTSWCMYKIRVLRNGVRSSVCTRVSQAHSQRISNENHAGRNKRKSITDLQHLLLVDFKKYEQRYDTCMVRRGGRRSAWPRGTPVLQRIEAEAGLPSMRGQRMAGLVERERTMGHGRRAEGHALRLQVALRRDGHDGGSRRRRLQIRIGARRDRRLVVLDRSVESLARRSRRYAGRRFTGERRLRFYIRLHS